MLVKNHIVRMIIFLSNFPPAFSTPSCPELKIPVILGSVSLHPHLHCCLVTVICTVRMSLFSPQCPN